MIGTKYQLQNNNDRGRSKNSAMLSQLRDELDIIDQKIKEESMSNLQQKQQYHQSKSLSPTNPSKMHYQEEQQSESQKHYLLIKKISKSNENKKRDSSDASSKSQEYKKTIIDQLNLRLKDSKIFHKSDKNSSSSSSISYNTHKLSTITLNNNNNNMNFNGMDSITRLGFNSTNSNYGGRLSVNNNNINLNESSSSTTILQNHQNQQQPISYKIYNEILNNSRSSNDDRQSLKKRIIDKINEKKSKIKRIINDNDKDTSITLKTGMYHNNNIDEMHIFENNEIKIIQERIEQVMNLIKTKTNELETTRKILNEEIAKESLCYENENINEIQLRNELHNVKKKLNEILSNKQGREKINIEALKEKLKKYKNEVESTEQEIKKVINEIKSQDQLMQNKEQKIDEEFQAQIKQYEAILETTQQQKYNIHTKLAEAMIEYDQNLEQKAILKEDLNGKLLQRAELVAQREELDQIYEEMKLKNKIEIQFADEECMIKEEIIKLGKALLDKNNEKKEILPRFDYIVMELTSLNDRIYDIEKSLPIISNQKLDKLKIIQEQQQNQQNLFYDLFKDIDQQDFQQILQNLTNDIENFIKKRQLIEQLDKLREEEQKLSENLVKNSEENNENKLDNINNIEKGAYQEMKLKIEYANIQTVIKKDFISKWIKEIVDIFEQNLENEVDEENELNNIKENYIQMIEQMINQQDTPTINEADFHKLFNDYFQLLQQDQLYIQEKAREERNLQEEKKILESQTEKAKELKNKIDEELKKIDDEFSKIAAQKKNLEQKLNEKRSIIENHLQKETELAFNAYLQQQSSVFEAITRTYGLKASQNLKKEHHKEFFEITKNNQMKTLEKFKAVQKDLKYLDEIIKNNIKMVDEEILPTLRKLLMSLSEEKSLIKNLKKQHISLIEKEDEINEQLVNTLQQINNLKLKLTANVEKNGENKEQKQSLEKKLKSLTDEINLIEKQLLDYETNNTCNVAEELHLKNEMMNIENKLHNLCLNINNNNNNTNGYNVEKSNNLLKIENDIEKYEKEIRMLRKELENLDINKIALEQKIIEQNFLSTYDDPNCTTSLALNIDQMDSNQSFTDELGQIWQLQQQQQQQQSNNNNNPIIPRSYNSTLIRSNSNENELIRSKSYTMNTQIINKNTKKKKQDQNIIKNHKERKKSISKDNTNNIKCNEPFQINKKSQTINLAKNIGKTQNVHIKNMQKMRYHEEDEPIKINQNIKNNSRHLLNRTKSVPKTLNHPLIHKNDQDNLIEFSPKASSGKYMYIETNKNDTLKALMNNNKQSYINPLDENMNLENIRYSVCDEQENKRIKNQIKNKSQNMNDVYEMPLQNLHYAQNNNDFHGILDRPLSPTNNSQENKYPLHPINEEQINRNLLINKEYQERFNLSGNMNININELMNHQKAKEGKFMIKPNMEFTKRPQKSTKPSSLDTSLRQDINSSLLQDSRIGGIETTKDSNSNPLFRNYAVYNDSSSSRKALVEEGNLEKNQSNKRSCSVDNNNNNIGQKINSFEEQNGFIPSTGPISKSSSNSNLRLKNMVNQSNIPPNSASSAGYSSILQPNNSGKTAATGTTDLLIASKGTSNSGNPIINPGNCKHCREKGECSIHKKIFKFNMDNTTLLEINLFEAIKPLLEGSLLFKKFASYQSLKKIAFDPLNADQNPPESCGYGVRNMKLNRDLDKIEIRHGMKFTFEASISIDSLLRPIVPQITIDILKVQKKLSDPQLTQFFHQNGANIIDKLNNNGHLDAYMSTSKGVTQKCFSGIPNIEKYMSCSHYPFSLILDKGGRLEFIAPNYTIFKEWINGFNHLIKNKKILSKIKHKIDICYI